MNKAIASYDTLLVEISVKRFVGMGGFNAWSRDPLQPDLSIIKFLIARKPEGKKELAKAPIKKPLIVLQAVVF
ncbi:MAG TPA: hypothetical protein EYG31_08490 [Porticoccaceae bacterium]|jgi:hypothetical protein|nr:hypothetical protein [Gammaproteobacteria bacterium]HIL60657.1 hypothetical protein [Porticoccaceae bacterium]